MGLDGAVAEHLKLAKRLEATEKRIAMLEAKVKRLEAVKPQKPESASSFKARVLSALGAK